MTTQCSESKLVFHAELDSRQVEARFDGREIASDAGGILLREIEKRTRILGRMSECFADHRDPERIEHTVESLVKQRVLGLCLGYEDLNDHDELCRDPKPTHHQHHLRTSSATVTVLSFGFVERSVPASGV